MNENEIKVLSEQSRPRLSLKTAVQHLTDQANDLATSAPEVQLL